MRYVNLHGHTTFSTLDGYGSPREHVKRATELGMTALALTEHGNVSSHVPLEKACKEFGIKPIYGCELYMAEGKQQSKNHLTVLAKNLNGYRNLMALVSKSWSEGYYYQPTVDWQLLCEYSKDLWVLSGCQGSLAFTSGVGGKQIADDEAGYERLLGVLSSFKAVFGDRYFLEVQALPSLVKTCAFNPMAERASLELDIPLVATLDTHYPLPEDVDIQIALHFIRNGQKGATVEDLKASWGYTEALCLPDSDAALTERLERTGVSHLAAQLAISQTTMISEMTGTYALPSAPPVKFETGGEGDAWGVLRAKVWKGVLDERKKPVTDELIERVEAELEVIDTKGFSDYFLIVADLVRWAKENDIAVGPARGSCAASLVCYLLGITEVNPMDYPSMVFDRFIDEDRDDLPDIDIDFDSHKRGAVRGYLVSKYGADRVSNIGTFAMYRGRNSVDDITRVYRIPKAIAGQFKDLIVEGDNGDYETIQRTIDSNSAARDLVTRYPELAMAARLEGNVRGMGVHAAGIVVSSVPITDVCAVYSREVAGQPTDVISLDQHSALSQGILKIDVLGLNTMSVIDRCIKEIGDPEFGLQQLYDVPLDDAEVMRLFQEDDLTGIFQFEGPATRKVCREVQPKNIMDLAAINALSRPGALGGVKDYVAIRHGVTQRERLLPAYDEITADTEGQIIFQEQILRICREVSDMSASESNSVRRAVGKKAGSEFLEKFFLRFQTGVVNRYGHLSWADGNYLGWCARTIWDRILTAGYYAFNVAHSISYSILAYYTAYLKHYHPLEFHLASLIEKPEKTKEFLASAISRGLEVWTPDCHASQETWSVAQNELRAGWQQVEGIGEKVAKKIVEHDPGEWADFALIPGIGPKTVDKIRTFCESPDPFGVQLALTNERNRVRM